MQIFVQIAQKIKVEEKFKQLIKLYLKSANTQKS